MFRGSSFHTIDTKGRIIIPARFRDVIKADGADGVMVSRMDSCLVGYPFTEWRKIEAKILAMAEKSDNMRRLGEYLSAGLLNAIAINRIAFLFPLV